MRRILSTVALLLASTAPVLAQTTPTGPSNATPWVKSLRGDVGAATANGVPLTTVQQQAANSAQLTNGVVPTVNLPLAAIAAYLAVPTPLNLPDTGIYQRDTTTGGLFNKGTGTISFQVYGNAPLNLLEYRLRDATTGNILQDWSTMATGITPGTKTYQETIPAGLYWYYLDLRPNGLDASVVLGTARFAMGEVLAISGQSLADRLYHQFGDTTLTSSLNIPATPFYRIFGTWSDPSLNGPTPAWQQGVDGSVSTATFNSAAMPEVGRLAVNAFGVPVAIVGYSFGGTAISTWAPGQPNNTELKSVLTAAGGKFHTLLWFQGHADSGVTPAAIWTADLTAIVNDLATTYSAAPFKTIVSTIPDISNVAYGVYAAVQDIRKAGFDYVNANPTKAISDLPLDLSLVDGVHFNQLGAVTEADHLFRAWSKSIGLSTVGDAGPAATGITLSGNTITIPTTQAGGTAFTAKGDPTTQFQVFNRCTLTSPYAVSAVTLTDPTKLTLTLGSTPAAGSVVDVWYRPAIDTTAAIAAGIYDNNTADGLSANPLTGGRQLQAFYAGYLTTDPTVVPCLTLAAASTFDTTAPKFGPADLSGGYGYVASGIMPTSGSWTLEVWVKMAAPAGNIQVLVGYAGQPWVGVSSGGFVAMNGAETSPPGGVTKTGTIKVTDGTWHLIDYSYNATTNVLTDYVDRVVDQSYVGIPATSGSAIAVGALNSSGAYSLSTGLIDEAAVFSTALANPAPAVPSTAYAAGTAGAVAIWPLDGTGRGLK